MKRRIIFNFILLGAVFFAPWWVTFLLGIIGAFVFEKYFEIFGFGVLFDLLYGAGLVYFGGIFGVLCAGAVFLLASYARKIVR
ncbi:MAG: hypothetical protein Q7K40_03460 [bacterium]|nr:hypothetical protein [bacterium]